MSYDSAAADNASTPYGDPWQLVYVFDGDTTTNVVCEGYAKAFKYLCDLTTFSDTDFSCYIVTGTMSGGTGAGGHMWNIVTLGGMNYLVDVTNCDEGASGAPDKLFLKGANGAPYNGSTGGKNTVYSYPVGSTITYQYYDGTEAKTTDQYALWGDEILKLADSDYTPPAPDFEVTVSTDDSEITYDGTKRTPDVTVEVTVSGTKQTLTKGTDYEVSYGTNINAGTGAGSVTVSGKTGTAYAGKSTTVAFDIKPKALAESMIQAIADQAYTGSALTPEITVKDGEKTLTKDEDYESVTYSSNTNAGTATVTVAGKGNYTGTATKNFTISPKTLTADMIQAISDQTYTGSAIKPAVVVKDGTKTLASGTDYEALTDASYSNNTNVGTTASVTVTGKGNYTGNATKSFNIVAASVPDTVKAGVTSNTLTYTGAAQALVTNDSSKTGGYTVTYSTTSATATDFGETIPVGTDAGNYTVYAKFSKTGYTDAVKELTVTIGKATLAATGTGAATASKGTALNAVGNITGLTVKNGSAEVAGTWKFTESTALDTVGTQNYTATFTPTAGAANYTDNGAVTATVAVTVVDIKFYVSDESTPATAENTVTITEDNKVYGKTWGEIFGSSLDTGLTAELTSKDTEAAHFALKIDGEAFSSASSKKPDAGVHSYAVTYTGTLDSTTFTDVQVASGTIEIARKPVTLTLTKLDAKTYDGANTATIPAGKITVTSGDIISGEALTATYSGAATYADANVGTDKAVTLSGGTFTLVAGANTKATNYKVADSAPTSTTGDIIAKSITPTIDAIPDQTFTGSAIAPTVTVKDGSTTLTKDTDYTLEITNNVNAGTANVTVKAVADKNYTFSDTTATFTIKPKTLTAAMIGNIAAETFTGSAITPAVTVTDGSALTSGTDYEAPVYSNNTNRGTATVSVTGKGNYTGTATKNFTINPKSITPAVEPATITAQAYTGSQITPAITSVKDGGTGLASTDYTVTYGANVNAGTGTGKVTVSPAANGNYTFTAVEKTFDITAKTLADSSIEAIAGQPYAGAAGAEPSLTVKDGGKTLTKGTDYDVAFTNNTAVGEATATVTFKGNYNGTATAKFNIVKAAITITADDKTANVGDKEPEYTFTVTGLVAGESLTAQPAVSCSPDMSKEGEYEITVSGAAASENYDITYVPGKLTVSSAYVPYIAPVTNTDTTANPDGSTTTTTTRPDGTVTATTTEPDGSRTVIETKPDGTITETTTEPDGSASTTTTAPDGSTVSSGKDANGTTATAAINAGGELASASANVTPASVAAARASGEPVTLPVEIPAAGSAEDAAPIAITMPAAASPVDVEIPVADVNPGVVAVIVNPDGTEEIVKDCVVTEDGVVLGLDGSATVKVVDNTKTFDDVPESSWASDAVRFVAAREIFNGTGEKTFSPSSAMSRGMLAQVLYNFDKDAAPTDTDAFTDTEGAWYDDAANWAAELGVVNGTGNGFEGDQHITREQLATMLYRYARVKGYDAAVTGSFAGFGDAGDVSDYAREAMRWAIGKGLINGTGTGLDPRGDATRAQVATIMARFCANVVR